MKKNLWFKAFSEWMNPVFTKEDFKAYKEMAVKDLEVHGKYIKKGNRILDLGCGIACTAVSLSSLGYKMVGIDNERKVVEAARQNAKNFGGDIEIIEGDIFNLDKIFKPNSFNACISGGLLEHFDKDDIRKLVKLQLKLAPVVLADMPVKTKATIKHYGFTEKNAVGNVAPNGIYRNFWSEKEWINDIFKGFNIVEHLVKRIHPSIGNFDELFVVIKR